LSKETKEELIQKIQRLKEEKRLAIELPHKYKFKEYSWQIAFRECSKRMKLLTAANQIGKSSTQIAHVIELACNQNLWPIFFPKRKPKVFWYIYPTVDKIEEELSTKWAEFLPTGEEAEEGPYSWKQTKIGKNKAIRFIESDVLVIFKTWRSDLQSGTLDGVFCDEEIPAEIYPELAMRIARYDGLFCMVFTATLNQAFWFDAMEKIGKKDEKFVDAFKIQVSAEYDCEFYADGTLSPWTPEKIESVKKRCGSQTEIDRRVHGRFVSEEGLKYASFNEEKNCKDEIRIEFGTSWLNYSGIDYGGGGTSHPAAIAIVTVKDDFSYGITRALWKGNDQENTTAGDILEVYSGIIKPFNMDGEYYDWSCKDLKTLAERHGYNLVGANKNKVSNVLNVLWKNRMLDVDKSLPFAGDLVEEIKTLRVDTNKRKAKDDLTDALHYATSSIPWEITTIKQLEEEIKKQTSRNIPRREMVLKDELYVDDWDVEDQFTEINELSGGF